MKLAMRVQAVSKKVTLITTAFVLAVSTLTAVVPFVLSQVANAAPSTSYNNSIDVAGGWNVDRTAPSGGYGPVSFDGRNALELRVDAPTNAGSSFNQYEGVKKSIGTGSTDIKADLYVDPTWPENVRAGFWAVGYEGANISSYPIIEYNSAASSTNWRIWDSTDATAGWREVSVPSTVVGWNKIEISINQENTSKADIYVNGVLVGSSAIDNTNDIRQIILNNYNFGESDYSVRWSNISSGVTAPSAVTGLNFVKKGTSVTVANSSAINYSDVSLKWNATPNTERYQIRVTDPNGNSQASRNTGTPRFDLNDAARFGFFGSIEGAWKYEVRSKNVQTQLWSNWSEVKSLTFDSLSPILSLPEGSIVGDAPYSFAISQQEANPDKAYVEIQQMVNGKWKKLNGQWFYSTNNIIYSIDPSVVGLQDNAPTQIKVNSWDKAGNQSSKTVSVTTDLSAPIGSIRYGNTAPINGNVIAYLTTGEEVATPAGWDTVGTSQKEFKKKFTTNTNSVVTFYDQAGNPGTAQVSITWIDKTAPVVAITDPQSAYVSGVVSIVGTVSDAHPMNSYFKISGPNGYTVDDLKTTGLSSHSLSWDTTSLENGLYTIQFEARDKAQNKDAGSTTSITLFVDNQKPDFAIDSPSTSSEQPSAFTVTGTASDTLSGISAVEYNVRNLDGGYGSNTFGSAVIPDTSASYANGTWSFNLDDLQSGFYRIAVKAMDGVGNSRGRSIDVYVDASGPVIAFSASGRVISGTTSDPGRSIILTLGNYGPYTITPASGAWSFTLPNDVPAGSYAAKISTTDIYGNPTVVTKTVNISTVGNTDEDQTSGGASGSTGGDGQNQQQANTPAIRSFAGVLGANSATDGTTDATDDTTGTPAVEGTSTEKNLAEAATSNTDGKAFGLAWYWWLLILAALATIIWWIIAAIRNRQAQA